MAAAKSGRSVGSPLPLFSKVGSQPAVSARHSPRQNHLLDALPDSDYERLATHLELIPMRLGDVLYESGDRLRYVYFPTTSIVSLLYVMEDGASAEIAVVGNEGLIGIALFMGGETTPSRAIVQSAGYAYPTATAELLKDEFDRYGPTMQLLLRYTQALITQMAQTAVCNRHHSVDQQLVPVAAAEPGSPAVERTDHDAGADRQHARRPARRRHGGRGEVAGRRLDSIPPWQDHGARSPGGGGTVAASATRS